MDQKPKIELDEANHEMVIRVPETNVIPSLLAIVKMQYRKRSEEAISNPESQKINIENIKAIEVAIDEWMSQIKEEKIARERFAKIKENFDSRWNKW
nr:hypothetical protein [Candidatus Sigynarchaeota archaeon]